MDCIYADIMKTEKEEKSMFNWLQTLPLHTFQVEVEQPPTSASTNTTSDNKDTDNTAAINNENHNTDVSTS